MFRESQNDKAGGDLLVVRGRYVGTALRTGKPLRAAFAHF